MATVNQNLKFLRAEKGLTQKQLAEKLGLKQATIGAYEEERATPPLPALLDFTRIFQVSLDALVSQDLSKISEKDRKNLRPGRGKEVLAITMDASGKENVELVMQKASAGYLNGYQDPEFVRDLPKINLPVLNRNRTYRAFEIQGDSMLPIQPGSIIFGEHVEDVATIKNGKLYILVTNQEGIVFKRVFNFNDEEGKILLVSDNRQYAPYAVASTDVLELWAAKGFYSSQFPEGPSDNVALSDQLALQLVRLQSEGGKKKKV
ncbi:XRE family transcriptional regulator [Dawidia soli]|uniref:LexA family transcriptional regulator n=1 Tax=Dawidia soli TaxID=2782352 RepID=A0AAP2DCS6_9BACT|nr:XRE family transcriptional regulator [Dawidia soli]MBT1686967.1 LexA family transcriptional regulator [Dawidia soli]